MSRPQDKTVQTIKKGLLYCTPFLFFFVAVVCFVLWLSAYFIEDSAYSVYYDLAFNGAQTDGRITPATPTVIAPQEAEDEVISGEFTMPAYASQWATLNVDGWEEKDVPVYYGNSAELLRAGAAQAQYSRFCGQNGKVILSAHVNRHFYEIEDSVARFEAGEEVLVRMDTLWGSYVYKVCEVIVFDYLDTKPLMPQSGQESLFFYTCYPRENSYAFKEQRIGLYCELVEGSSWEGYLNA